MYRWRHQYVRNPKDDELINYLLEFQYEGGDSAGSVAAKGEGAAAESHYLTRDGKAYAASIFFRSEERHEYMFCNIVRYFRPII